MDVNLSQYAAQMRPIESSPAFFFEDEGVLTERYVRVGSLPLDVALKDPALMGRSCFVYTQVNNPVNGEIQGLFFHHAAMTRSMAEQFFRDNQTELAPAFIRDASRRFEALREVTNVELDRNGARLLRELHQNPHSELAVVADEVGQENPEAARAAALLCQEFRPSHQLENV